MAGGIVRTFALSIVGDRAALDIFVWGSHDGRDRLSENPFGTIS